MTPSSRRPLRVALVNDFELIVRGLADLLRAARTDIEVVELDVGTEPTTAVDVALFDTFGHARLGLERIDALVRDPAVGEVVVYTWHVADQQVEAALALGVRGVIAKSSTGGELADALHAVGRGDVVVSHEFRRVRGDDWPGRSSGLTEREGEVIACLANGLSNRDIADAINISQNTVKTHLKSIFQKLRVRSRTQAIGRIQSDDSFRRRLPVLGGREAAEHHSFG